MVDLRIIDIVAENILYEDSECLEKFEVRLYDFPLRANKLE